MRKQRKRMIVALLLISLLTVSTISGCGHNEPTSIEPLLALNNLEDSYNVINYKQFQSYGQLGVIDGKLYLSSDGKLYCFDEGAFQFVIGGHKSGIAILDGKYIYQKRTKLAMDDVANDDILALMQYDIYCYDPKSKTETPIVQGISSKIRLNYCTDDQTLLLFSKDPKPSFYKIKAAQMVDQTVTFESYVLGENTYVLEYNNGLTELVCYNEHGERKSYGDIINSNNITVFPYKDSLLVHKGLAGDMLYRIDGATGNVDQLFSAGDNHTNSAVNMYKDHLYLSFERYTKQGFFGMTIDENDTANGTYRINLADMSVEKISDAVYLGMFIFDGSCIFACRSDGIVCVLDFDGNLIAELQGFHGTRETWPNIQ